jgi:hypothetical protein
VHLVGLSIEHVRYQNVRNHEYQIQEEQKLPAARSTLHDKDLRCFLGYDVMYWKGDSKASE